MGKKPEKQKLLIGLYQVLSYNWSMSDVKYFFNYYVENWTEELFSF